MVAIVWAILVIHALGLLVSLLRLVDDKPWPRPRKPATAEQEMAEAVIHIAFIAWTASVLVNRGH